MSSDLKVGTVRRDDACDFGRWLYGEGAAVFPDAASYACVRTLHADFHREAAIVLSLALAGHASEARAAMADGMPFSGASVELVAALNRLGRRA